MKYSSEKKWQFIAQRLRKREREGKESDVYLNGNLVLPKKLQREISRHVRPAFAYGQASGSDQISTEFLGLGANVHIASEPQTPDGVSVCTPAANADDPLIWLPKLPCFNFEDWLQAQCI